jgi:hypothetical protein|tara:strand:- start:1744 stop:1959 length:216 start_codon:yes stop_codon:yes gene_type:complete
MNWKAKTKTSIYFLLLLLRAAGGGVVAGLRYGWKTSRIYWKTERIRATGNWNHYSKKKRTRPRDIRRKGGM